jgi:hypothetical protein
MTDEPQSRPSDPDEVELLRQRLGPLDPRQVAIWRQMSGARRLELVGQAYRLALETVRVTESRQHPNITPKELNWRVIRRMHGDLSLGKATESNERDR